MEFDSEKQNGFTLIELLVVISVMGLMASIFLVSVKDARIKARDAKRRTDAYQMAQALNLFYDANQYYPTSTPYSTVNGDWTNGFKQALSPYAARLPTDPLANNLNRAYYFTVWAIGGSPCFNRYVVWVALEDPNNVTASDDTCGLSPAIGWIFKDLGQ